jgi:hypothetical protein
MSCNSGSKRKVHSNRNLRFHILEIEPKPIGMLSDFFASSSHKKKDGGSIGQICPNQ